MHYVEAESVGILNIYQAVLVHCHLSIFGSEAHRGSTAVSVPVAGLRHPAGLSNSKLFSVP